jgi:hypothetical protein
LEMIESVDVDGSGRERSEWLLYMSPKIKN